MSHGLETGSNAPDEGARDFDELLRRVRTGDELAACAVVEQLHGHVRKIVLAHLQDNRSFRSVKTGTRSKPKRDPERTASCSCSAWGFYHGEYGGHGERPLSSICSSFSSLYVRGGFLGHQRTR